ncbi:peroxiredoxin [Candidatus Pacearchaeota archaeon]|nr:peroxiredoxin [Candidatus Pacearchaeota archaeon]
MLKQNSKAPDFELKDKNGKIWRLKDFKPDKIKFLVLYFYPKDNTPGCTIEAKEFSALLNDFKKLKTEVIGISGGDESSKKKFHESCDLNSSLILLSDPDFKICKKYGVYGQKSFMGKKFLGIKRTTFILRFADNQEKIVKVYENVKALGHAKEVLEFISHGAS